MASRVRIQANQNEVARLARAFREVGETDDGWTTVLEDPVTGERWHRCFLGAADHGGGMPVLVKQPSPDARELLDLCATSSEPAEVAAAAWLLTEIDSTGEHKEALLAAAEEAVQRGDVARAVLLVGWGALTSDVNLRPVSGKPLAQVNQDHAYFQAIATRARHLLGNRGEATLRDPAVFAAG